MRGDFDAESVLLTLGSMLKKSDVLGVPSKNAKETGSAERICSICAAAEKGGDDVPRVAAAAAGSQGAKGGAAAGGSGHWYVQRRDFWRLHGRQQSWIFRQLLPLAALRRQGPLRLSTLSTRHVAPSMYVHTCVSESFIYL